MDNRERTLLSVAVSCILGTMAAPAQAATGGAALTVQQGSPQPVVRSARRDTVVNESFTAGPNDTFELLLNDGTSLTLSAGTRITVERYTYDPAARLGELVVNVQQGAVRVIGGVLNNTNAATLKYPGGTATLDNGIAIVSTGGATSTLELLLGKSLNVATAAGTRTLTTGQRVEVASGGAISEAQSASSGNESRWLVFNPGLTSGVIPQFVNEGEWTGTETTISNSDESVTSFKEAALVQSGAASVLATSVACTNCAAASGYAFNGAPGNTVNLGSDGTTSAQGWVRTFAQDQNLTDNGLQSGRVDYDRTNDGYRNTTNLLFGGGLTVSGTSQSLGNVIERVPNLRFVFGTSATFSANYDLASTLWLSADNSLINNDYPGFVTTTDPNEFGSINSAFTFDASGIDYAADGNIQTLSLKADTDNQYRNILQDSSSTPTGTYRLLSAGLRRADVTWNDLNGDVEIDAGEYSLGNGQSLPCSDDTNTSCLIAVADAFENRGFQAGDRASASFVYTNSDYFLLIQGEAAGQQFLFATGAVTGRRANATASVDRFTVTSGLDVASRAFLPSELGLAANNSDLIVINPAMTTSSTSRVMHSDFGNSATASTVSLTLGTLTYGGTNGDQPQLVAATIGSARDEDGSVSVSSPLESTAIGGGNPALADTGRAGYIVLQNYDDCSNSNPCITGGTIDPVGSSTADSSYAVMRLATATSTSSYNPSAGVQFAGAYLAGLVENNTTTDTTAAVSRVTGVASSFLTPNIATATLSGSMELSVNGQSANLTIGGDLGSAYLDNTHFAAFASTGASASLSDATAAVVSADQLSDSSTTLSYTRWGYFFGDFTTASGTNTDNWHAHLVPWATGTPMANNASLPTGTATYAGIVAANVSWNNQLYTAEGTYSNKWNFATRYGSGEINLDSQRYPIRTQMTTGSNAAYSGMILPATSTTADLNTIPTPTSAAGTVGNLSGTFVNGSCSSNGYCGAMGQFDISTQRDGTAYNASGVFAADKTQ